MRKKREILILLTMLLTVALICGCSTKEEQNNEQKVEGVEIEEDTDTYRFVDVLGNDNELSFWYSIDQAGSDEDRRSGWQEILSG